MIIEVQSLNDYRENKKFSQRYRLTTPQNGKQYWKKPIELVEDSGKRSIRKTIDTSK